MRQIAVHPKSIVLVLNTNEAAAIAHLLCTGYLVEGKVSRSLRAKLWDALTNVGKQPRQFGLPEDIQ